MPPKPAASHDAPPPPPAMAMRVVGAPDVPRYTPAAEPPPAETYAAPIEVPFPPAPKPAKKVVVPSSHQLASKRHPLPP